jgi:multiple sugar transport system substrate-binding protein
MVAFSWDIGPSALYYRADIFKSVGLPSEPEEVAKYLDSWPNVLEAAKKLHIPGERWFLTEANTLYMDFFHNRDYYDKQLNFMLDRPGDLECLDVVIQMRKNGLDMNANIWSPEGTAAVNNGAVVGVILGSWFGGFLKDDFDPDGTGNWRATRLPGNVHGQGMGGSFCAIPAQSKNKDAAWAFLEYVCATKEGQNAMFKAVDYFPAYQPAWDDPIYDEADPYFGGQKTRELYTQLAEGLDIPIFTTIMDQTAEGLISGAISTGIEQGMTAAQIKTFIRSEVETGTAELRRQQIQTLQDAGVWGK